MIRCTLPTRFALAAALAAVVSAIAGASAESVCRADEASELVWETDYGTAMRQAEQERKMILIHFFDEQAPKASQPFLDAVQTKSDLHEKMADNVLCRLPLAAQIKVKGEPVTLLEHAAFAELEKQQGLIVIDFANEGSEHYGHVVNSIPFKPGKYYRFRPDHLSVLLDLPPGTLTQRTMVFAVRIHPEQPESTTAGEIDPILASEAKKHSAYQAKIRVQGHHHWDARFPRIAKMLPFGLRPQEVVAESWPAENLMDAAVDCVHSWRQSDGHWGAVKRDQPKFAYDMRRGGNGIWYATGLFGNRH